MGSIRLGKLALYWCCSCNLPVLGKKCGRCSNRTEKVKHTPPGDIRPAFGPELEPIKKIIDRQFGNGCGKSLIPDGNVVVLNRIPHVDRMEEIIVSGDVVGNLRYDVGEGYSFLLKPIGAVRIAGVMSKNFVTVYKDAAVFIKKGRSVLAPGIKDADTGINIGDEVVVITENKDVLGPGIAKLSGEEMIKSDYGLGIRLRKKWKDITIPENYENSGSWEKAVEASENTLENYEREAHHFIKRVYGEHSNLPVVVSLSGGKDSLAVLLLVLDSGFQPDVLFLNTGLEFPETIENVRKTVENFNLNLITVEVGDRFWELLKTFGPPARDFRWCCKVCKLGPVAREIDKRFPGGVVSFIGQRSYESFQRSAKPEVWKNPWVPGQIGASPIQNWTALHIWLYIFMKNAEYNPLYKLGIPRIGCWLCPASDHADYLEILDKHPDGKKWQEFLEEYANEHGFTKEWVNYGLWKWKQPPGFVKDLIGKKGIKFLRKTRGKGNKEKISAREKLDFLKGESYPTCEDEHTAEGMFSRGLDIETTGKLLNIIGKTQLDLETGVCSIGKSLTLTAQGSLTVRGKNQKSAEALLERATNIVLRAEECVGCGICVGKCKNDALFLDKSKKVDINPEKCTHCLACLGKCPVTDFREETEFEI